MVLGKRSAAKEAESLADLQALANGDGMPPPEDTEEKLTRKPRADKGKTRTSKARVTKTKVWLLEAEAGYVTQALQMFLAYRYGVAATPPDAAEQKHLVGALRSLEKFPPFAFVQRLLMRIIPFADPKAKPGGSVLGGLVHYCIAWHGKNDGLALYIYTNDPIIPEAPFLPKRAASSAAQPESSAKKQENVKILTPEEYLQKETEIQAEQERMAS